MTPRWPNWARDWIICGRPIVGPCEAWKAMNRVPTRIPSAPPTIDQPSDSPSDGPMKPMGMEKYWKLPRNHSGAWCQSLPVRSSSGTQSIDRASIRFAVCGIGLPFPRMLSIDRFSREAIDR